jgi:peptide/nickel transport system substrate-binding protein
MGVAAGLVLALCWIGTDAPAQASRDGATTPPHACLVVTNTADLPFERAFNPFGEPLDFTVGGIYEPLLVITSTGREYKWLASGIAWSKDGRTLTLTVRHGVQWSDGRPLTNRDVLYTLTAGKQDKDMDQIGLTRPGNHVESIDLVGADRVAIHFKGRDSSFVASVLANDLFVVPEHVFAHIRHVGGWTNPHPVGTGPFTVVRRFGTQAYVLGRNPHYWLQGAPHFPCLERVIGTSSESALLAMVHGDIDFTNNYYPNAQQAYVAHDPRHFHFFYPANTFPVGLYFDDTRYPFSLAAFRKAISRAVDRDTLSRLAEGGYAPPVDAIGLDRISERVWGNWVDPTLVAEAKRLASYDPAAARRELRAAGFSYARGALVDPRGHPVAIKAEVVGDWSDWVTSWRVITRNLEAIGIPVKVELMSTMAAWIQDAFSTKAATLLWTDSPPTLYGYFREHFDTASFIPSGKDANRTGDFEHFQSPRGTKLLAAFRNTFDLAEQHRIAAKLERLWLQTLPVVPLYAGPEWSTYNTTHFVGFPNAHDFYVDPFTSSTDFVVALTRIRPA